MNNKLITATSKTDTHLVFDIQYSVPLTEVSEELANDVCDMFNQQYPIPIKRYIEFTTSEEGKELFKVSVVPKTEDQIAEEFSEDFLQQELNKLEDLKVKQPTEEFLKELDERHRQMCTGEWDGPETPYVKVIKDLYKDRDWSKKD